MVSDEYFGRQEHWAIDTQTSSVFNTNIMGGQQQLKYKGGFIQGQDPVPETYDEVRSLCRWLGFKFYGDSW